MGLKPSDRSFLTQHVTIVFHGAATVNFNETLRIAVGVNVTGTKNLLELAKDMKKLKVISAYCRYLNYEKFTGCTI
jgi:fatty acyl-CoA reductase